MSAVVRAVLCFARLDSWLVVCMCGCLIACLYDCYCVCVFVCSLM